jgi:hypothetical protein
MELEKKILAFVKKEKPTLEIAGLRGLVKSGENEWSFRFTHREGDFLSVSKIFKIKLEGIKKTPIFIGGKKLIGKTKKTKNGGKHNKHNTSTSKQA